MLRVALTGGIATGKSYVLDRLRHLGIPCLDADQLAHGVQVPGTEATAAIAARFGNDVLAADGSVDRARLGPLVFVDPAARRDLEAIVHPAVYRAITAGLRAFERTGEAAFAVVDIPLLHETGRAKDFDRVVTTVCARETQLSRLVARGLSEVSARQRLDAQMAADQKAARSDYVIVTDGSFDATRAQVDHVVAELATLRPR